MSCYPRTKCALILLPLLLFPVAVGIQSARGQSPSLIQPPKEVQGLEANRPPTLYLLPAERNTGTKSVGNLPSCVPSNQNIECFIRALASSPSLLTGRFAGGQWSPWTSLGGSLTSSPSCFIPGPGNPPALGNISCIALGLNQRPWLLHRINGQWNQEWQSISSDIQAPVGVTCAGDNCYARGNGNQLLRHRSPLHSLSLWETIPGGTIDSKPECFSYKDWPAINWTLCLAARQGKVVSWKAKEPYQETLFGEWLTWPGLIATFPSCTVRPRPSDSGADFTCAALNAAGKLVYRYHWRYPIKNEWQTVVGTYSLFASYQPACPTHRTCFAIGTDQKLWRFDLSYGSDPTIVVKIPGAALLRPGVSCVAAGNIHCFAATTTTGDLMHYEMAP